MIPSYTPYNKEHFEICYFTTPEELEMLIECLEGRVETPSWGIREWIGFIFLLLTLLFMASLVLWEPLMNAFE